MATKDYDGYLLAGDTHAVAAMGISVGGNPDSELATERLALSCDSRIPACAMGYVSDLLSDTATRPVRIDRLRMLSQYVAISIPS